MPVSGTFDGEIKLDGHWYGLHDDESNKTLFETLFGKYGLHGNPIIDTMDIKEGGTYVGDIFDLSFIVQHKNEYDLILVPDCGGRWYTVQDNTWEQKKTDAECERILFACKKMMCMLKPKGVIHFGKFLRTGKKYSVNGICGKEFFETFVEYFEGCKREILNIKCIGKCINIQKQ